MIGSIPVDRVTQRVRCFVVHDVEDHTYERQKKEIAEGPAAGLLIYKMR